MSVEDTITTLLSSIGIESFPLVAPHDQAAPFVVYQEIPSNLNIITHDGYVAERSRWQMACWAYTYGESSALAEQVRAAFDLNTTDFEFAKKENKFDFPDPDTNLYRKILEFYIWK